MFDVPPELKLRRSWSINLPLEEKPWNIGLILGPSGSGKTCLLRELSGAAQVAHEWKAACLLDDFPKSMGIKQVVELLCAVGFSSPPDWLKPFSCLSNGEQFRVSLARALAEETETVYIDEFTSVVDRTVAQVASAALGKAVRRANRQVVLASCHYDILEWLIPDWVCEPHLERFAWSDGLQRPPIQLQIQRVHHSAWQVFAPYHYLSGELNKSAKCFVAFWQGVPVAFTAVLPFVGRENPRMGKLWRESRTVCLPDYQGVGIGSRMSESLGAIIKAVGGRWSSTTSHPAMIGHRNRSGLWRLLRKTGFTKPRDTRAGFASRRAGSTARLSCGFEYVGPPWGDAAEARRVWDGV
jgi:energy-coupling factor transporter ATP-binding protein EcfA2/GNAT superfamily N-acetyltransferase